MISEKSSQGSFHSEFVAMWKESNQKVINDNLNQKYAATSKLLGQYASINNQSITIYNTQTQEVLYISENYWNTIGYRCTEAEYKRWSTLYWMRDIPLRQSWFMVQISLWYKTNVQKKVKNYEGTKSLHFYLHNFALRPPGAQLYHLSMLVETLEFTPSGSPLIFLIIKKDIGSLLKEDSPWWAEVRINDNEPYHFHQEEKKFQKGRIITDREREVLLLVKEGKETKQIAEQLSISTHTVDKHRKNMLERTGAKDTSCLIQIAENGKLL